jgi:hypothetical protein
MRIRWTAGRVPDEIRCGSPVAKIYTYSLWRSQGGEWVYVVKDGPNDGDEPAEVHGRRDVFVAFRRLMRAVSHDSPKHLTAVHRAGKRIRRAVR